MNTQATAHLETASIDLARAKRCGFPEVVYAEGKATETVIAISFLPVSPVGQRIDLDVVEWVKPVPIRKRPCGAECKRNHIRLYPEGIGES